MKFDIQPFSKTCQKKFSNRGYLCTFMIECRSVHLKMRDVSDKTCRENQNTHFVFSNLFPKTVLFVCRKIWYSQTGHRLQYNTARALCMLDN
jgi:hypothetical protein